MTRSRLTRRRLVAGAACLLGGGLMAPPSIGLAATRRRPPAADTATPGRLPARETLIIRNAFVMTMDRATGDVADTDVLVRDGVIVAVGKSLPASGARAIDGRGMIVMPGLVETHWHMWNTLLRAMSGDTPERGYFRTTTALGKVFGPEDMFQGTRLAAAEAINSGITTVHDWCHNIRGAGYADADIRALIETGIRARFSYGWSQGMANGEGLDLPDVERLAREWDRYANGGLLTLGFAWRGMGGNNPATAIPEEIYRREIEFARKLNLPITVHASGSRPAIGQIDIIAKAGLLAGDMQVVHANAATPAEIEALAKAGASVSMSPTSELRIGFGLQQVSAFLAAGVPLGLSVDTVELAGNADMFGIMKILQNVENGKAESEFKLPARKVLELGTIEGARAMGLDAKIGSLIPGKRADLIMLRTGDINMGVFGDPAHMVVTAAQPANVDMVMIDGRVLKRGGKLTSIDVARVTREASDALAAIKKRANWT